MGQLSLVYREGSHGKNVPALQLLGLERPWPLLFEPRITALMGNEFKFIGWERCDRAWVLQEWDCELL